ncbi:MAG: hypothetical protein KAG26_06010 [Methylococcales bacterium]|nr:hypothetical protein [Methylococcales bacterium]
MKKIIQTLITISCLLLLVGCVIPQQRSSGGVYGSPVIVKRDQTYRNNKPASPYDSRVKKYNHKYDRKPNQPYPYKQNPSDQYSRQKPYNRNKNYNPRYKQHGNPPRRKDPRPRKYRRDSHDNDHTYRRDRKPLKRNRRDRRDKHDRRYDRDDYPHSYKSRHPKRDHSHDSHHQNDRDSQYNNHDKYERNNEDYDYNDRYERRGYKRKVYKDYGRSLVGQ